jgi:hypothetical protein
MSTTDTDPTFHLRACLEHLERILEAAEAVTDEIQHALDDCEDEPIDTVREILNGVHLSDIDDIEGGLLDLKFWAGPQTN